MSVHVVPVPSTNPRDARHSGRFSACEPLRCRDDRSTWPICVVATCGELERASRLPCPFPRIKDRELARVSLEHELHGAIRRAIAPLQHPQGELLGARCILLKRTKRCEIAFNAVELGECHLGVPSQGDRHTFCLELGAATQCICASRTAT